MTEDEESTTGGIEITVFTMKNKPDGGSTIAEKGEQVDFYDVCVRDEEGEYVDGKEDLTRTEEVDEAVNEFIKKYPNATLEYVW